MPRMRRGGRPSLLGTAARTAVIAGTATSVSGAVAARQQPAQQPVVIHQAAPVPLPPQPAPVVPQVSDGLVGQLQQLAELRQRGVLTDEQFEAAKGKLLGA